MKFEELQKEVDNDLKIDQFNLTGAAADNCLLHQKYLKLLFNERGLLKKLHLDLIRLKKNKYRYYMGYAEDCPPEELDKTGIKLHIEGDDEVIDLNKKIMFQEEKVKYLEDTCSSIVNRGYNIKHIIEVKKFENGIN